MYLAILVLITPASTPNIIENDDDSDDNGDNNYDDDYDDDDYDDDAYTDTKALLMMLIAIMIVGMRDGVNIERTPMIVTIGRCDFPPFITSIITTSTWVSCRAQSS